MPLTAGTRIGRYEIRSPLGAGGMGEVYLAQDTKLDRAVALKILPAGVAQGQGRMRRFAQEARAALALNRPNVAHIYEIEEADGHHFIAMEYIEGETLRRRLRRAHLSLLESLDIALQVAAALSAAHAAGVTHRDIKPENIMVRTDGYVKVLDFGLAKLAAKQPEAADTQATTRPLVNTEPGMILGTAQYMSPEQARGLEVDARTDLFSFGVVLYEMAAGHPPFEGKTPSDLIAAILEKEPPPLARYAREAPEALEWIITKALVKEREGRYQTAQEMLTDLRRLKRRLEFAEEQERSVPPGPSAALKSQQAVTEVVAAESVTEAARTNSLDAARRTVSAVQLTREAARRKRWLMLAAVSLVLMVVGVFAWLKYFGRPAARPEPFARMKVAKLITSGKASWAAISPDGKYVVHVMGGAGQQSIWLRHIATGSDKEIVAMNGKDFVWVNFSRDGGYVFYNREEAGAYPLYQVPILGGTPKRLTAEDVDTPVSFSPDGQRFTFMRGAPQRGEVYLMIANADGTREQRLATHKVSDFNPGTWSTAAWSPDGQIIAFARRTPDGDGHNMNVVAVSVKDGTEKQVTFQRWYIVDALAWLADGSGLIITAADREAGSPRQIWHVSYPSGEARKVTNDTNNYVGVSLTADSKALVTVQTERESNIWVVPNGDAGRATQLTSTRRDGLDGTAWTPDGHIVYTSLENGLTDIWIMNGDGTGQTQLTTGGRSTTPAISPDGRYIAYASYRAGNLNIWRMGIDGGNPVQLTNGAREILPSFSPDGRWVLYTATEEDKQRIRKVPVEGGTPVHLTDYTSASARVSPDGKLIACGYVNEQEASPRWRLAIIPSEGGPPIKSFDIPVLQTRFLWAADGRAILYTLTRDGVTNVWSQPVDGGPPKQVTDFKSNQIFRLDWSSDGKRLVIARGSVNSDVVMISDTR
jgi:Tol biopolymer transport system component/predicted Ser/Thr protein kinase